VSAVRVARSIGLTLAFVILAVSGAYVVIDLARWEWNRAIISALIFLSALVVIVGMLLFRELRVVELRLRELERRRPDSDHPLSLLRSANRSSASRHFRWLERPPRDLGVVVPVLLGAGVVLSFVAYLVERTAGAFAASTLDPRTLDHLATHLPLGDAVVEPDGPTASPRRRHRPVAVAIIVVLTVVSTVAAVQGLRELTQTRPDELTTAGTTSVVLDIRQRRQIRPITDVAGDLWSSCRSRLPPPVRLVGVAPLTDGRVELMLDRSLGRTGRARIEGCFEDYTLDLVLADVVRIESRPTATIDHTSDG
jgi:hypothetical protein